MFKDLCPNLFQGKTNLCAAVQKTFLENSLAPKTEPGLRTLSSTDLKVVPAPFDKTMLARWAEDPNKMVAYGFCYFTFKNWISPSVGPDQMGLASSGFSILKNELGGYKEWLKSEPGKACQKKVTDESKEQVVDLEQFMGPARAILFLNPIAFVGTAESADKLVEGMKTVFDHERIHVLQGLCPEIDSWSLGVWKKLPPHEAKAYEKTYPDYKWSDPKIAGRESVAFAFEGDFPAFLKKMEKPLSKCAM